MKQAAWTPAPRAGLILLLGVSLLGMSACVSTPQANKIVAAGSTSPFAQALTLTHVPFFPQQAFQCGPAALATVLQSSQVQVTPEQLVPRVYLPVRQGSLQVEMLAATRHYGRLAYVLPPSLPSVLKEVKQGRPVLVLQNLGLGWYPRWHYAVVVGYDISHGELILHSGTTKNYAVPLTVFERTWRRAQHWALVVLQPGELPVDADELPYLEALSALQQTQADTELYPALDLRPAYVIGLQRWPTSNLLAMGFGNLLYDGGRKQAAAKQFATLLSWAPDYAPAHNNLAQVLLELGDNSDALRHAQAAVALGGPNIKTFQATLDAVNARSIKNVRILPNAALPTSFPTLPTGD